MVINMRQGDIKYIETELVNKWTKLIGNSNKAKNIYNLLKSNYSVSILNQKYEYSDVYDMLLKECNKKEIINEIIIDYFSGPDSDDYLNFILDMSPDLKELTNNINKKTSYTYLDLMILYENKLENNLSDGNIIADNITKDDVKLRGDSSEWLLDDNNNRTVNDFVNLFDMHDEVSLNDVKKQVLILESYGNVLLNMIAYKTALSKINDKMKTLIASIKEEAKNKEDKFDKSIIEEKINALHSYNKILDYIIYRIKINGIHT
jgi:hypothetical protein